MTKNHKSRLAAGLSATALALLLQQPVLAEDAAPATGATTAPPAVQSTTASAAPQRPAQAARAAMEERWAAHMAELNKRYSDLREQATGRGFEIPSAPPWTEGPQWLSFEEMQKQMKAQGITLEPPVPSAAPAPTQTPTMGQAGPEEQKRIFDTIEKMTPAQQQACFAVSRWHTPRMPRRMPPAYFSQPMPQYPPGYLPRYGQPYRGMMRPQ